ncbi:MAG: hypothetical protein AAF636_01765 [Pseudomonadota bacterium]
MFDDLNKLELSSKDIELIESALHTQKKILSVQSEAGGAGARRKLSDLKHLLKRVNRASRRENDDSGSGWSHLARTLFCASGDCTQIR